MKEIRETDIFAQYIKKLRDRRAVARIAARIDRLRVGNPGDVTSHSIAPSIKKMGLNLPHLLFDFLTRGEHCPLL
jgi:putative component of toxin-antitoxin plasmid stabilization module